MPDAEWSTPSDEEIIAVLESGLILSPAIIAANCSLTRSHVSRRLATLVAAGEVTRLDRGRYALDE